MTYRELLDYTQKHPSPFRTKAQSNVDAEIKYSNWIAQQTSYTDTPAVKNEAQTQKKK